MAPLAFLIGLAALPVAVSQWRPIIAEASQRFGVPAPWIEQVIHAESGGRTTGNGRPLRSRAGAIGLMQLMPSTWDDMRRTYELGTDPDDPHANILAGTAFLRSMYDRFGYPGLFAAYNAGPARYALSLATGRRLPAETLAYLDTVTGLPGHVSNAHASEAMQSMFVVRYDQPKLTDLQTERQRAPSVFAVRSGTP